MPLVTLLVELELGDRDSLGLLTVSLSLAMLRLWWREEAGEGDGEHTEPSSASASDTIEES